MALYLYFDKKENLPNPNGLLAQVVPSSSIEAHLLLLTLLTFLEAHGIQANLIIQLFSYSAKIITIII